jgi:hypothetical protein
MPLPAGTRLGPYQILSLLGAGGMGEVYKAIDTRLGRSVAVKVSREQFSARFEREARSVGALNHPHICQLYDVGSNYLVMELVEGARLSGPLPLRKALTWAAQICDALDAAHGKGIVHRDLKPANIMVTKSGVKLLDFGLAKRQAKADGAGADPTQSLTAENTIVGTLSYMAPEQVRGLDADARSDIFAFGCVLYEMLSGKQAFGGSNVASVIAAILEKEPPEIDLLDPPAPAGLRRLLRKCLAKDPESRWQSVRDLGDELRWIGTLDPAEKAVAGQGDSAVRRRFPLGVLILSTFALAGIIAGIWGWVSRPSVAGQPTFQQLTFREGSVSTALFQPDGGFAYTATWTGVGQRIYSGRAGDREHRELPSPVGASLAAISPAGELAIRIPTGDDPASGQMLALAPGPGGSHRDFSENVLAADWAPDGSAMAVLRGGPANRIEYPPGRVVYESNNFQPQAIRISHDGKLIAVAGIRLEGTSFHGEVGVIDRSGRLTALNKSTPGNQYVDSPVCWSPDGREVWFAGREMRDAGIVYAATLKGKLRRLLQLPNPIKLHDVRPDGGMLASVETSRSDIKVQNREGALMLPWFGYSIFPKLTADGKRVIFEEAASGQFPQTIYLRSLDNSPAIKISDGIPITVAPSGRYVIAWRPQSDPAYVIVPTGAGQEKPIRLDGYEPGPSALIAWVPNERSLIVRGREPAHQWRLVSYDIDSGTLGAITGELNVEATSRLPVSPDGSSVFAKVGNKWLRFPIRGGTPTTVKGTNADEDILQSAADGRHVITARLTPARGVSFFKLDIETGARTQVAESTGEVGPRLMNADVSADGSTVAYRVRTLRSTLYLISGVQ